MYKAADTSALVEFHGIRLPFWTARTQLTVPLHLAAEVYVLLQLIPYAELPAVLV